MQTTKKLSSISDVIDNIISELGYGWEKDIYLNAFEIFAQKTGYTVIRNDVTNIMFHNKYVGTLFLDMIINNIVIINIDTKKEFDIIEEKTILEKNLKIKNLKVGYFININYKNYTIEKVSN